MSNQNAPPGPAAAESQFGARLLKIRHEFHNSLAHILGFGELWLDELPETGDDALKQGLQTICQTAARMMARVNEDLLEAKVEADPAALAGLRRELEEQASRIIIATENLARESQARGNELFKSDLARIAAAGRGVYDLACNGLPGASSPPSVSGHILPQPTGVEEHNR